MKQIECAQVYLNNKGEIVDRGRIEVIQAYNAEDAAETFMEILFNNDPEVIDCICMIDGDLYNCRVDSMPTFNADLRE